jgi:eukaryotic-like serine/threonine-protein kinase
VAKVAVKILDHRGVAHRGAEQIRREASLLARQSHAHIARLLDAGFGEEGQPFLILEYVEGTRIDEYCGSRALPLDASLAGHRRPFCPTARCTRVHIVGLSAPPCSRAVTARGHR